MLVGGHGNLRGVHTELQVASCQVVGPNGLNIAIQLGSGVAVGLGVPRHPIAGIQIHKFTQGGFRKSFGSNDANFGNFGGLTLCDVKSQIHTIAFNRCNRGDHFSTIQTFVDVLTLKFLFSAVQQCLIKGATITQTHIFKGLANDILVKLFDAFKLQFGNKGALFHHQNHHICRNFNPNVFEQP